MSRQQLLTVTLVMVFTSQGLVAVTNEPTALDRDLFTLEALRDGRKPPLHELDERARRLLRRYTDGKSQGQICHQAAHVYAQGGVTRPDQIIKYAKKGLSLPLDPRHRVRLCVYMADALRIANRQEAKQDFPATRREAARYYLKGLREVVALGLPERAPELPGVGAYDVTDRTPGAEERAAERQRRREAQMKARELAEFQCEMILYREALIGQIVEVYSRPPFATEEAQRLAEELLKDKAAVASLMAQVKVGVQKTEKEIGPVKLRADRRYEAGPEMKIGDIATWCVAEFPLPRDREQLGGGEQVWCWLKSFEDIDHEVAPDGTKTPVKDMLGDVIWTSDGGTVFPCVGHRIVWTLDIVGEDTKVSVTPLIDDANLYGVEKTPREKPGEK